MKRHPSSRSRRRMLGLGLAAAVTLAAGTALAGSVVYDFSSVPVGTTYQVGDHIDGAHATFELDAFQLADLSWYGDGLAIYIESTTPREVLRLDRITARVVPDVKATFASFEYEWRGGNVNLVVNGSLANVAEPYLLDGAVLGGCEVDVTKVPLEVGYHGIVSITPQSGAEIEHFATGGQEYAIDDVRHDW